MRADGDVGEAVAWLDAGAAKVPARRAEPALALSPPAARQVVLDGGRVAAAALAQLPRERVLLAIHLAAEPAAAPVAGAAVPLAVAPAALDEAVAAAATLAAGVLVVVPAALFDRTVLAQARRRLQDEGVFLVQSDAVQTAAEIAALDKLRVDAVVGQPLWSGRLDVAEAWTASLVSDRPDGLFATVVVDEQDVALGLVYSSRESVAEALRTRRGVYQSRRHGLWLKGETSGATQDLLQVHADCDRDTLKFVVRQHGAGFARRRGGTAACRRG